MVWAAWAIAWISTAAAVSVGIVCTGEWKLVAFMILPALIRINDNGEKR